MRKLVVIWSSAGLLLAIDASAIVEVLPPIASRPAPGVPGWVRGLFAYRGTLIPLVDAASLLSTARPPDRMANRVLVVRASAGAAATGAPKELLVGLWVESVLEIEHLDFDAAGGHPGFATEAGRFLGAVIQSRWGQIQLLEPGELFTAEQASMLSARLKEDAA